MKEIFFNPLCPIPLALVDSMGTLKKANKTILMHELEKNAEPSEQVLSHFHTIIDGKVLVRKLKTAGLIYEEFTLKSLWLCQVAASQQEWMLFVICIAKFRLRKLSVSVGNMGIYNSRKLWVPG